MKLLTLLLFLSLFLYAQNMSLGPFNDPEFKTIEQRQLEKEAREKELEERNKAQVKAFEKRQLELREKRREAYKKRLEKARLKKALEEERLAQEEALRKEKEALLQKRLKEEAKVEEKIKEQERKREAPQEQAIKEQEDGNFTLTPSQDNILINSPDDIESDIANIYRLRDILLRSKNTPEFMKDYILFLEELNEEYNLDLTFSYRGIAQSELDSNTYAGGSRYDLTLRYRATEQTHFAFKVDVFNQIGQYSSSEFKDEFGALSATSAVYRNDDPYLSQAWLKHSGNNFLVRAGKLDSSSLIDSHLFKSSTRFFFNSTFSASPYNAYPANGIGIVGRYSRSEYYLTAEVTDANAVRDEIDDSFFSENEYYSALEFGLTPEDGSKYHITAWHKDPVEGKEEAQGLIGSFVQTIDPDTHLIIRGALASEAKAEKYASIGIGKFSLFKEHDISGLAIGTLVPEKSNDTDELKQRTQTSIESFYRIDPVPGIQLSADLQLIYHPSKGTQTWAILPGLRLRIIF